MPLSPFAVYLPILLPQPHPRRTQLLPALCTLFIARYALYATCVPVCLHVRSPRPASLALPPTLSPFHSCFSLSPSIIRHPSSLFPSLSLIRLLSLSSATETHGESRKESVNKKCVQSWRRRRRRRRRRRHPSPKRKAFSHRKSGQIHTHTHAEELEKRPKTGSKRTSYLKPKLKRTGMPHELSTICIRKAKLNE